MKSQSSFLDPLTAAKLEQIEPFEFTGEGCEPRTLADIPPILRLPGEEGYMELDAHYRPVAGRRG